MTITWKDLTVPFDYIDPTRLLKSWDWLIGTDKTPILMSSIGDLFLVDNNGIYFWLNSGEGIIEKVAENKPEFEEKLTNKELVDQWFLTELVSEIKQMGLELTKNKLYGFKTLPVFGGDYIAENFELIDIVVHFELSGLIHKQIKDLPDGTKVKIITK
jgi:hypothetical protein